MPLDLTQFKTVAPATPSATTPAANQPAIPTSTPSKIDLSQFKVSTAPTKPSAPFNLMDNVAAPLADKLGTGIINTSKDLYSRGKNLISDTISEGKKDQGKPLVDQILGGVSYGAKKGISTIAGGAGDILTDMIKPFLSNDFKQNVKDESAKAINDIKDAWNAEPTDPQAAQGKALVHNFITSILGLAKDHPEASGIITDAAKDAFNIAGLSAGGTAEDAISKSATAISEKAPGAIDAVTGKVSEALQGAKDTAIGLKNTIKPAAKTETQVATDSLSEAQKVLNPNSYYTQGEKEAALKSGDSEVKGVKFGPLDLRKDVVAPKVTPQTEVIQGLVDEGKVSSKNLPSQNLTAINQEARIADSGINDLVNRPELNKPFTGATINKVFNSVANAAKKDLVFVADSTEERAYNEVIKVAKEEIFGKPMNNSGLRSGIKAFNARMEKILGSDIYSGASESVGNARLTAAKDMRTALNGFLADNLESAPIKKAFSNVKVVNKMPAASEYATGKTQAGSLYKAQLQREAQLLNSRDELAYRASRTVDKTRLAQWVKAHPKLMKAGYYVGGLYLGGRVLHDVGL